MIQALKHFTFRIWATLLFGGILSIALVTLWQSAMAFESLLIPVAAAFTLTFLLSGWLSNRYGVGELKRLQDEAAVWERAGRTTEAEAVFEKALAVCDSFLLSPRTRKKKSFALIAQMARFHLARAEKDQATEAFVLTYLEAHPEDSEFAENWLQQIGCLQLPEKKYHDIAHRIGNALPENIRIQHLLASLYLSARRTDFPAQQVYRRALSSPGTASAGIVREMAAVFLHEGRADEWALDIYLKAFQAERNNQMLKGIAACLHWVPQTERTIPLLRQANRLLGGLGESRLKQLRAGFMPPPAPAALTEKVELRRFKIDLSPAHRLSRALRRTQSFVRESGAKGIRSIRGAIRWLTFFRASQRARVWAKWSFLSLLSAGMIVFVANTVSHFGRATESDHHQKMVVEGVITDPFTLQVAAYLNPEHAKQYVAFLKKQNIDAYWTEAPGKNKKWYQVRVSHFPDKKSAISYGETLKSNRIINDFFVANY